MKERIYIESTIVSYLAARPSRDVVVLARQELTRDFWHWAPSAYELCSSELTRIEIGRGDADVAQRRLDFLAQCRLLPDIPLALELAQRLIAVHAIPETEPEDAVHIAIATLTGMKYVVSWNFSHMVGAQAKRQLETAITKLGHIAPILATPEEIYEEEAP